MYEVEKSQCSHLLGFIPICALVCSVKLIGALVLYSHWLHLNFFFAAASSCSTESKPESTDEVPENVGDGVRLPPGASGSVSGEDNDIVREFNQTAFFNHDVFGFGTGLLTKIKGVF